MALPIIAIAGRPNVGKSTLFNRLLGQRTAIVSDVAGTTRDRISRDAKWLDSRFILVDTGGIEAEDELNPESVSGLGATEELLGSVQAQTSIALEDADVLIFVVDAVDGVTAKDILLVATKADNDARELTVSEFYELGAGDPIPISAYHNIGIKELMDAVFKLAGNEPEPEAEEGALRIAIVGRPNVGKSAMLNAITGESRAIVSPVAGTTRDAVDTDYRYGDRDITLIDTAGLRRRGKAGQGIEKFSVLRSIQAIERAEVALLLLDATELVTAQDTHVAGLIEDAARGAVIVVNKWDLADKDEIDQKSAVRDIRYRLKFLEGAPITFTSAVRGRGVEGMLDAALRVYAEWTRTVDAGDLQRVLLAALAEHPIPTHGRGDVHMTRVVQTRTAPPSFVFRVNQPERIHFSYKRYLENKIRDEFGFAGAPLRLHFRTRI